MHGRFLPSAARGRTHIKAAPDGLPWMLLARNMFHRTATEDPEHYLLHHPTRSAPSQMQRVTAVLWLGWTSMDLEGGDSGLGVLRPCTASLRRGISRRLDR